MSSCERVTQEMVEAGCAAYARFRSPLDVFMLPWTTRRMGIEAAYRAMRKVAEGASKDDPA